MTKNNAKTFGILTGVFAVFVILIRLLFLVRYLTVGGLVNAAYVIGFAVVAIAGFADRRDMVAPAGFAFLALMSLISIALNFFDLFRYSFFLLSPLITYIISLAGYLAAAFILLALFTDVVPAAKEICKKIWFLPSVLLVVALLIGELQLFAAIRTYLSLDSARYVLPVLIRYNLNDFRFAQIGILTALFAGLWASKVAAPEKAAAYPAYGAVPAAPSCGQQMPQYGQPVQQQYAQQVPQYSQPVQQQYTQPMPQYAQSAPQQAAPASQADMAEQIRKYKDLLDEGTITQAEFDELKRRILGL